MDKITLVFFLLMIGFTAHADEPLSLFGSKPIQLSVGKDGIKQNKVPGYTCTLDASVGGGHYSEWGETEADAREIVYKKCWNNSGLLLCKKDKASCKKDQ